MSCIYRGNQTISVVKAGHTFWTRIQWNNISSDLYLTVTEELLDYASIIQNARKYAYYHTNMKVWDPYQTRGLENNGECRKKSTGLLESDWKGIVYARPCLIRVEGRRCWFWRENVIISICFSVTRCPHVINGKNTQEPFSCSYISDCYCLTDVVSVLMMYKCRWYPQSLLGCKTTLVISVHRLCMRSSNFETFPRSGVSVHRTLKRSRDCVSVPAPVKSGNEVALIKVTLSFTWVTYQLPKVHIVREAIVLAHATKLWLLQWLVCKLPWNCPKTKYGNYAEQPPFWPF